MSDSLWKDFQTKKAIIVTGGAVDKEFLIEQLSLPYDYLCTVDKGLEAVDTLSYVPNYIVGDFDSIDPALLNKYVNKFDVVIERFNPMKDDTDTQLAVKKLSKDYSNIVIIGATGSRVDHVLGSIYTLSQARDWGSNPVIIDRYNRIKVINSDTTITKEEQYGKYISIIPFMGDATVTLKGFVYNVENFTFSKDSRLFIGVSNEMDESSEKVEIIVHKGEIMLIESKD